MRGATHLEKAPLDVVNQSFFLDDKLPGYYIVSVRLSQTPITCRTQVVVVFNQNKNLVRH